MIGEALLLDSLVAGYGDLQAVRGLSLVAPAGRTTVLLGRNGAGKTTTLSAVAGILAPMAGRVVIGDDDVTSLPAHRRVARGISLVAENKRVFRRRTVDENLTIGSWIRRRDRARVKTLRQRSYELFPQLANRRATTVGSLSGGQQQMVAIAQALMSDPTVLLLDEPSAGLAPVVLREVLGATAALARQGMTVVLGAQLLDQVLPLADRVVVLEHGRLVYTGTAPDLDPVEVREAYLGLGTARAAGHRPD